MYCVKNRLISPDMLKYIRDATNKSLKQYKKCHCDCDFVDIDINDFDFDFDFNDSDFNDFDFNKHQIIPKNKNTRYILSFVSLISFLAGYNFRHIIGK
jgi:hypothetical protein